MSSAADDNSPLALAGARTPGGEAVQGGRRAARKLALARASARQPRKAVILMIATLMLMWSAIVNGRPPVFPDTALYYSQAEYLTEALGLTSHAGRRVPEGDPTALPQRPGAANISATIDGARSPIYGLFVYGLQRLGGLWLVAAAQAAMAALALYVLFRAAAPRARDRSYLLWVAGLAASTSLPFFASFVMPDVFAGVAGVASLTTLVYWNRLGQPTRLLLSALLVFALCTHRSNLATIAGLDAAGFALFAIAGSANRPIFWPVGLIGACVTISWALGAAAFLPINQRAGELVRDPPFLMARVLADGPGRSYLSYACAHGEGLALCRFRGLPREDSDTLLWSGERGQGLFGVADYRTRLRLEREEPGFVLGALAYAPLQELEGAALNVGRQLMSNHVKSPLADQARYVADGYWRRTSLARIIPDAAECRIRGPCASRISPDELARAHDFVLIASLVVAGAISIGLLIQTAQGRGALDWTDDATAILCSLALAAALILINATVCGALSAPAARYQARLIWILPALASLATISLGPRLDIIPARDFVQRVRQRFPQLTAG